MKLLVVKSSPVSRYLLRLSPRHVPQHPILGDPKRMFCLQCWRPRSYTHKNKSPNHALCFPIFVSADSRLPEQVSVLNGSMQLKRKAYKGSRCVGALIPNLDTRCP